MAKKRYRRCRSCPSGAARRIVTNKRLDLCAQCASFVYRHTRDQLADSTHMANFMKRYLIQTARVDTLSTLISTSVKFTGDPYRRYQYAMKRLKKAA